MKPKTLKEFLILAAIVGGIILPVTGFVLFFTDHGSPAIFDSIGATVAVLLGILFWFGLGLAGIVRAVGTALIIAGVTCLVRKPIAGVVCLLIGFAFRLAVSWMTRPIHEAKSPKSR